MLLIYIEFVEISTTCTITITMPSISYIIKGEKDIKKNHDYTILRQVFDMAKEGGDDWVEDRFYNKGKKIE